MKNNPCLNEKWKSNGGWLFAQRIWRYVYIVRQADELDNSIR